MHPKKHPILSIMGAKPVLTQGNKIIIILIMSLFQRFFLACNAAINFLECFIRITNHIIINNKLNKSTKEIPMCPEERVCFTLYIKFWLLGKLFKKMLKVLYKLWWMRLHTGLRGEGWYICYITINFHVKCTTGS